MEIKEVFDDVKDTIGSNGLIILAVICGGIFIYNLTKSDGGNEQSVYVPTAYASYPDATTNANVIIDTLQNSIDYSQQATAENIQGMEGNLTEFLTDNFEATNNYIQEGLDSQNQLMLENFENVLSGVDGVSNSISNLQNQTKRILVNQEELTDDMTRYYRNLNNTLTDVQNQVEKTGKLSQSNRDTIMNNYNSLLDLVNKNQKTISNKSVKTSTKRSKSVGSTSGGSSTKYFKATSYNGVSIVDGLKNIGANSSYSYRKRIAQANGISDYRGTSSQNLSLLSKLKSGKLINPD